MKELSLSFLLLILTSWIPLFAQGGNPVNSDTVKCYGIKELQNIAAVTEYANTCDTILTGLRLRLKNKDQRIEEKILQVGNLQEQIFYRDTLIINRENKIGELDGEIIKLTKHKKLLKLAWVSTTAFFSGIILFLSFR